MSSLRWIKLCFGALFNIEQQGTGTYDIRVKRIRSVKALFTLLTDAVSYHVYSDLRIIKGP